MDVNSRRSLGELRNDITILWLPMRQDSVAAVEGAQTKVRSSGASTNGVKYYSSAVKALSSGVSLVARGVSNFGVSGTGVVGAVSAVVGLGSDVTKTGANFVKTYSFGKIMEEAQRTIDREIDAYRIVSNKMQDLGGRVPGRGAKVKSRSHPYKLDLVASVQVATHLESGHYFMNTHTAEVGNDAGSNTALNTLRAMAEAKAPIKSPDARADIMKDLCRSESALTSITKEEVKAAVDNSFFSPLLPANTTEKLTEASGQETTRAAYKAFELLSDEKGGKLVLDPEMIKPAINHTKGIADPMVKEVGRKLAAESSTSTSHLAETGVMKVASESTASNIGWALGNTLPLLAAAWGTYQATVDMSEASTDIAEGTPEERFLSIRLQELKDSANTVVNLFNAFASARGGVNPIPVPFPSSPD